MTPEVERRGFLGLGSNVGDREKNLQAAVDALSKTDGIRLVAASPTYNTEPVGLILDQPDYLNAALMIKTSLTPEKLLERCKAIETELGRVPGPRHSPRPIDIDLLILGDEPYASEALKVPHDDVASRRFVLVELLDLDPNLEIPGVGPARDALERLPDDVRVEKSSFSLRLRCSRG